MTLPRADGERVRFCMHCNEMVPFDVRVCPACGQFEPQPADERAAQRACGSCDRPVPASRVLCPHCGRETGLVPLPRESAPGSGAGTTSGVTDSGGAAGPDASTASGRWAVALALAGPLLLLAAVAATLA